MLKILYTDIRNIFHCIGFHICTAVSIAYLIGNILFSFLILFFLNGKLYADQVLISYATISIFLVTAATLLVFSKEYNDGIIKNKLVSGAKRSNIFLSSVITSAGMAFYLSVVNQITAILISLVFTQGIYNITPSEIAASFIELIIASVSIAVFSTAIVMMMGGTNLCYVVGLGLAFLFKLVSLEVMDKLYPEKGLCSLTGTKLALYTFYDKYVPYAHCDGTPRWSLVYTALGSLGLILISVVSGLIVFGKKEIK